MGKRNATIELLTPKLYKAELWFLCMTHCLIVLYNCMKVHLNSLNGCQLTEWTQNSIANDQREITAKLSETELWFLCMTHHLDMLYNCMKFHLNNLKVIYKGFLNSFLVLYASEKSSRNRYVENCIRIFNLVHKLQRCFSIHYFFSCKDSLP